MGPMFSLRNIAKGAILAGVFAVTAGATSCNTDGDIGPTFVTDLVLKNAAGQVRQEFANGELITLELTVRNRTNTDVVVQFDSGHQFEFLVVDSGSRRVRWMWSSDKQFTQFVTELEFAPGQTHTFTTTWNQVGDDKQPVGPGNYEARGVLLFSEFRANPLAQHQLGSPLKPFRIN
jgi:Intracellular proteinase inhibitor